MYARFDRGLVDPGDRIIVEVGLLDRAARRSDFAHQSDAGAEHRGALELRLHAVGVDYLTHVRRDVHMGDANLSARVHFHFDDCGDVTQEAPMRRDAQTAPFGRFLTGPAGAFRRKFDHAPQTPRVQRILLGRGATLPEIDLTWLSQRVE